MNGGRFKLHAESACPDEGRNAGATELRRELLAQAAAAEYAMRAHQAMTFFVPERSGHDDLLNAAALVVQAAPLARLRTASGRRTSQDSEESDHGLWPRR